jgi:hypothetical protein
MTNLLDIKVVIFKYSYDISISILVYSLDKNVTYQEEKFTLFI